MWYADIKSIPNVEFSRVFQGAERRRNGNVVVRKSGHQPGLSDGNMARQGLAGKVAYSGKEEPE